jgi:hypothetical protein
MTTMRKVMLREEHRPKVLQCAIEARENNECGFFYDENRDAYAMFNFREIVDEIKRFTIIKRRGGHRYVDDIIPSGHLQAIDHNNQTKMVDGKPVYTMVFQQQHSNISPLGLGFDDNTFLVSGWIYCFFNEKIRDSLFNKFFLLKEPPPTPPPTPVILVETKALEYFTQHYLDNTSQSVFELLNDNQDSPTDEIAETIGRIVRRNVMSSVLKTCKCEEIYENILEDLYHKFIGKMWEVVDVLREEAKRKRENNTPKKPKTKKVGVCITCKSVARLRCGGCKRACYCSAECQRSDWFHHKEICEGCN